MGQSGCGITKQYRDRIHCGVSNVTVMDGATLTAQLTVAAGAAPGPRSITAITDIEEATLPNGFSDLVVPPRDSHAGILSTRRVRRVL